MDGRLPTRDATPPRSALDVALFLLIAFAGSWGIPAVAYAAGVRLTPISAIAIGVPVMFCPALAALVVERKNGAKICESLEIRFRPNLWWLVAWLVPLALALSMLGVGSLLPQHAVTDIVGALLSKLPAGTPASSATLRTSSRARVFQSAGWFQSAVWEEMAW